MEKLAADLAEEIVKLLDENKCLDCRVFNMENRNWFADFAVIATYTSRNHLNGVARHFEEWMDANGIQPVSRPVNADKWFYWDCGIFVINLMDKDSRGFYNLEDLYGKKESEG